MGPAELDLAKLWDRELREPLVRKEFLAGYAEVYDALGGELAAVMRPVRLWAAAGIFPYARDTRDDDFFQHGLDILGRVEAESRVYPASSAG